MNPRPHRAYPDWQSMNPDPLTVEPEPVRRAPYPPRRRILFGCLVYLLTGIAVAGIVAMVFGLAAPRPAVVAIPTAVGQAGSSTWYCSTSSRCTRGYGPGDMVGAIDPGLGLRRGSLVRVSSGTRSIVVRIVDVCACKGDRVIDLTHGAFARLADPGRGVIPVMLEPTSTRAIPVAPATDE